MICLVRSPVVRCLVLALFTSWLGSAGAVGFGPIRIQSGLGQPLKAFIPLIGSDTADLTSTCIRSRLQSADSAAIGNAIVALARSPRGDAILLSTREAINEPAILVDIKITCGALIHRDFSILLDPIDLIPVVAAVAQTPDAESLPVPRARAAGRRRRNRSNVDNQDGPGDSGQQTVSALPGGSLPGKAGRPPLQLAAASLKLRTPDKSVLKLSNEGFTAAELASMGHLKLSASMADVTPPVSVMQRDALQAARNQFAQVLRGEDPVQVAQAERAAGAKQLTALKKDMATLVEQRAVDHAAVIDLKENSVSLKWVIGIVALLLVSLLGSAWLAWRLAFVRRHAASAWDLALASPQPDDTAEAPLSYGLSVAAQATTKGFGTDFGHHALSLQPAQLPTHAVNEPAPVHNDDTDRLVSPEKKTAAAATPVMPAAVAAAVASTNDQGEALQFHSSKVEHLKVEEISDVMQEAEFWMSLNDPQRAIEILEPYANVDLPESPVPWLYLLDLYRGTDERLKYVVLQEKASRVFNAHIPLWDEDGDLSDGRTLEDFPHVVERICALWETGEIFAYLESLIFDRREGIREGFDLYVYQEIMLLLTMVRSYGRERHPAPFGSPNKHQLAIE